MNFVPGYQYSAIRFQ